MSTTTTQTENATPDDGPAERRDEPRPTLLDLLNRHEADCRIETVQQHVEYSRLLIRADAPRPGDVAELLRLAGALGIGREQAKTDLSSMLAAHARAALGDPDRWRRLGQAAVAAASDPESDDGQDTRRRFLLSRGWRPAGDAWVLPAGVGGGPVSASDAVRLELAEDVGPLMPAIFA